MANILGTGVREAEDGGAGPFPELFATTAGNLNDQGNKTFIVLPASLCPYAEYPNCEMPKAHVAVMEAGLDFIGMSVFLMLWVVLRNSIISESEAVDAASVEVTDFAIFLPTIPKWFNRERIHRHFDRVLNAPDRDAGLPPFRIAQINIIDDGFRRLGLFKDKAKIDEQLDRLNSKIEITRLEKLALGDDGCCASCFGREMQLKRLIAQRQALETKEKEARRKIDKFALASSDYKMRQLELEEMTEKWEAAGKPKGGCCFSAEREIAARTAGLETMRVAAEREGRDPDSEDPDNAVAAFVIFDNDEDFRLAVDMYPNNCCYLGCCQTRKLRAIAPEAEQAERDAAVAATAVGESTDADTDDDDASEAAAKPEDTDASGRPKRAWVQPAIRKVQPDGKPVEGSVPIEVRLAPDPSTVLWENLNVNFTQQTIRRSITTLLALSLLVGSFVALYLASAAKTQLAIDNQLLGCPELEDIINATSGANGTLVKRTAYGQFDPKAQPVWRTVEKYLEENDPNSPLLNPATQNRTLRNCYCEGVDWQLLDLDELESHPEAESCPQQFCPALAILAFEKIPDTVLCLDWLEEFSIQVGLTIVASMAVVVVNQLLTAVIKILTVFDAYYSEDEMQLSLAWKSFVAQFFNTAILVVLVNAYIPGISSASDRTRLYEDFTSTWYANVGAGLVLTMGIQLVTPHIAVIIAGLTISGKRSKSLAPSQNDLNNMYMGPVFQVPLRYSQVYTYAFVVLVYSSGMPLLLWMGTFAFAIFYWVDLFGFVTVFRTPPRTAGLIGQAMVNTLPIGVFMHAGVAIWVFGNSYLFAADQALQDAVDGQTDAALGALGADANSLLADESVAEGFARASNSSVLPLLVVVVILLLVAALALLWKLFRTSLSQFVFILTCGRGCPRCFEVDDNDISSTFEEAAELRATRLPILNKAFEEADKAYESAVAAEESTTKLEELRLARKEALKSFEEVRKNALTTEVDFNLFRDKKIIEMFHLPKTFADSYDQLCDLRFWSPEASAKLKSKERRDTLCRSGLSNPIGGSEFQAQLRATHDKLEARATEEGESIEGSDEDSNDDEDVPDAPGTPEAAHVSQAASSPPPPPPPAP
jgi:hypothetical protein